jgi:hypothetical protein
LKCFITILLSVIRFERLYISVLGEILDRLRTWNVSEKHDPHARSSPVTSSAEEEGSSSQLLLCVRFRLINGPCCWLSSKGAVKGWSGSQLAAYEGCHMVCEEESEMGAAECLQVEGDF